MAYKGFTVGLPVGQNGFSGTANQSQALPGHLLFTDGAELRAGVILKEGGAEKVNDVALESGADVVSGFSWAPEPGTQHDIVFLSNGTVLRDAGTGAFATSLATGLNNSREPPPYFSTGGGETVSADRKLFMCSATNQMQVVVADGTTMDPIGDPAADWSATFPTFAVQHNLRMFAGGNASDPHRLYYSQTDDHEDYVNTGSGTLAIFPGEGEKIVGAFSFRGALIVWKYPTGIYVVSTPDNTPANWSVKKLSTAVGTLSPHTIVPIENDVFYMDRAGNIHALSATQEFGDVRTSIVSQEADLDEFFRTQVNRSELQRAVGRWYPARRQVWFAVPLGAGSDNDLRLIGEVRIDPAMQARSARWFMSRRDIAISLWMSPDAGGTDRPRIGDDAGFVWQLDTEARNKDGAAYSMVFQTANTDLSFANPDFANKNKNFEFLELVSEPSGDFPLDVEVYIDDVLTETVIFNTGGGGVPLGQFELDTDELGSVITKSDRQRITGSGRRIKLIVSNENEDQSVLIAAIRVSFSIGDESTGRNT